MCCARLAQDDHFVGLLRRGNDANDRDVRDYKDAEASDGYTVHVDALPRKSFAREHEHVFMESVTVDQQRGQNGSQLPRKLGVITPALLERRLLLIIFGITEVSLGRKERGGLLFSACGSLFCHRLKLRCIWRIVQPALVVGVQQEQS